MALSKAAVVFAKKSAVKTESLMLWNWCLPYWNKSNGVFLKTTQSALIFDFIFFYSKLFSMYLIMYICYSKKHLNKS